MTRFDRSRAVAGTATLLLLLILGALCCESSERGAPEGSTINLAATPAQIRLVNGVQDQPITVLATVRSGIGVPLPNQSVRFFTTEGTLAPPVGTSVDTDSFGNATTVLDGATRDTTITATSGKVSQTLSISASTCNLSTLTISPSPIPFSNCGNNVSFTVTARDPSNAPCEGVLVSFVAAASASPTPSTDITVIFPTSSGITDIDGEAVGAFTPPADCQSKCGGGLTCTGAIRATSGSVQSNPVTQLQDSVP